MASKIWYDVLSLYSISISLSMCDIAMNYLVSIYHQFFTLISNALQTTAVAFFSSVCCNFATFKSTLLVFFHLQSIQKEWLSYLLVHFTLGHRIQNALCYRFRKIFIIIISFRKWIEHFFLSNYVTTATAHTIMAGSQFISITKLGTDDKKGKKEWKIFHMWHWWANERERERDGMRKQK